MNYFSSCVLCRMTMMCRYLFSSEDVNNFLSVISFVARKLKVASLAQRWLADRK